MTARGGDILAWLTDAITKAEADADRWHDIECLVHNTTLIDATVLSNATLCDCEGPAAVRRRCAADRKLLESHQPTEGVGYDPDDDDTPGAYGEIASACSSCGTPNEYAVHFPCHVVRTLAEGYGWTEGER